MIDLGLAEDQGVVCRPPKVTTGSLIDRLKAEIAHPNRVVPGLKPKSGGEVAGPCPKCGGNDRFYIRADGSFGCRKCNPKGGDKIDFYIWLNDTDLHGLADIYLTDRQPEERKPKARAIDSNLAKVYSYTDESGAELFQVCRYEAMGCEKTFRQRHRSGNGYVKNLDGVRRVLYRLPEVMASNEVVFVEGEKDADNLAGMGFTATTSPMGSSNWMDEYTAFLSGKHVAVIPDNDAAGQKYADDVTRSLQGVAASVRVVKLPGMPEKGDVTDWLEAGGTRDQLISIIKAAPEYKAQIIEGGFQFIHGAELIENLRPIEWSIAGIQPANSFYYTFGDPGSLKTFVELDKGLCIAAGIPYHGHVTRQGTVFYICGEGQQGIGRRLAAWFIAHKLKASDVPFFIARTPMQLSDPANVEGVMRAIDAMAAQYGPPAMTIIDTLARNFGDGDENSTKDMGVVIQNLDRFFGNDFCRGLIHHTGHMNKTRGRGSIALKAAVDTEFRCSMTNDEKLLLECIKQKDAPEAEPMLFVPRGIKLLIGDIWDSSLVLDLVAEGGDVPKPLPLSDAMKKALEVLKSMGGDMGVDYEEWRKKCIEKGLYKRTDNFNKAAEKVRNIGLVEWDLTKSYVQIVKYGLADAGGN